jgi:hypothetical protein
MLDPCALGHRVLVCPPPEGEVLAMDPFEEAGDLTGILDRNGIEAAEVLLGNPVGLS